MCGEQHCNDENCKTGCGSSPRVRGTVKFGKYANSYNPGSSPRVRGTGFEATPFRRVSRFIPACAGNRPKATARHFVWPVHPRVCGEQLTRAQSSAIEAVHPRVCGEQANSAAGLRAEAAVHPRVCGEQVLKRHRFVGCHGSSPRVRGTGRSHAGSKPRTSVHPRVCGEQSDEPAQDAYKFGSSPRVRGTAERPPNFFNLERFIPACAGNRWSQHRWRF